MTGESTSPERGHGVGIELPEISCPFPAEISPHSPDVEPHTVDWAREVGLLDRDGTSPDRLVGPRFASCVHPAAPYRKLCFISKWYCWGFLEDDNRDETALRERPREIVQYQQPLLDVLEGEGCGRHQPPLVRAFVDLHRRWTKLGPEDWQERFQRHHVRYFAAHRWEARNRARNHVPVRAEYVRNMRVAAGMDIVFDLAELAGGIRLPASCYRSPLYRDVLEAAGNVICWTNDVYSLPRELACDEVNNLVMVVSAEQECSLRAASTEVGEMIAAETRRFEELCGRLAEEFGDVEDLEPHLTQLERAISGHLKYSEETTRYDVTPAEDKPA